MSDMFPPFEHEPIWAESEDVLHQLGVYGDILEDGYDRGLFGVTPKTDAARRPDDVRRRIIAMQLWLLGYLPDKPKKRDLYLHLPVCLPRSTPSVSEGSRDP